MTAPYHSWTSQTDFGKTADQDGGYHPHCGEAHAHKPVKAMIGVGLFVVLSFLLYEVKSPDTVARPVQHANIGR
jgi:hypothetical protein